MFGLAGRQLPSKYVKRQLFSTNCQLHYSVIRYRRGRSSKITKLVAQHIIRPEKSLLGWGKGDLSRAYVAHPYFINFEFDLQRSFWVFLGTPIFNVYFQRTLGTLPGQIDNIDTSFIDTNESFKDFYSGVFFKSKKKHNVNLLLTALSRLGSNNDTTESSTICTEFDSEVPETADYSDCSDDVDDVDAYTFRVYYDGDDEVENEDEGVEDTAPLAHNIWDSPYLFLNTIYGLKVKFDLKDYAFYSLLELLFTHVETELGSDSSNASDVYKFRLSKKKSKKIKRRRRYNKFYRKIQKRVWALEALRLFKNKTCKSFFISLAVLKDVRKTKLKLTQYPNLFISFMFEKTFSTHLNSTCLELLAGSTNTTNYLNIKSKFLLNSASLKTYQSLLGLLSEIRHFNRAASPSVRQNSFRSNELRSFRTALYKLKTDLVGVGKLLKLKNLKKSKLRNLARLNDKSKFYFILKKLFKRHNLVAKRNKRFYKTLSKILRMSVKKNLLSKFRFGRRSILKTRNDMFFSLLNLTRGERLKRVQFLSLVGVNTLPISSTVKNPKFKPLLLRNLSPSKKQAKVISTPKKVSKKSKRQAAKTSKKVRTRVANNFTKHAVLKNNLDSHPLLLSKQLYFLKNQILLKSNFVKNQYLLEKRQHLASSFFFKTSTPDFLASRYLDLNVKLLSLYFSRFSNLLNAKVAFKNYNKRLLTSLNVENYFNNFFVQRYHISITPDSSAAEKSNIFKGLNSVHGVTKNLTFVHWFTSRVGFDRRVTTNLLDSRLVRKRHHSIIDNVKSVVRSGLLFFETIGKLSLAQSTPDSIKLLSHRSVQPVKPFFKTAFNNSFVLSTYGFYYRVLPEDKTALTSTRVRAYLHGVYSFAESLTLKKNILKAFLIKPEYQISEAAMNDVYDTFGFNFYTINRAASSAKHNNSFHFNPTDSLHLSDYPFYNAEDEFEPEPDKSLRIKFKPGYSIIWRRVRSLFKEVFFLKYKYQHRLTTHMFQYEHNILRNDMYRRSDNNIHLLLIRNKFAFDLSWSSELLDNDYVFINGFIVNNPQIILVKGDFVQLLVHIKYYMILKWRHNLAIVKKTRVYKFAKRKFKRKDIREGADRNYTYPDWLLKLRFFESEIPSFVEIDFFTLSFLVIYNPFVDIHSDPYNEYVGIPKVVRLYNWKYIN